MSTYFERYQRRKLIGSYVSVVLVISLMLFTVGSFGLLALNLKKITNHFKEQVSVSIFLKEEMKDIDIKILKKRLLLKPYTKVVSFVSKHKAAEIHAETIGEDFITFLGYNPLQNSIDVHLKADFLTNTHIDMLKKELLSNKGVSEVVYDSPLVSILNENSKNITLLVFLLTGIFTFFTILIINSSIRLSIYSNRFIINTMQMVGATKQFIRRPFIIRSVRWGILGALVAIGLIILGLYYLDISSHLGLLNDKEMLVQLSSGILVLGIFIPWITTFFATQRFLNLRTDKLYY